MRPAPPTIRVGLLTTWNTRCGIAEYSRHLAHALRRIEGVEVTVFGSRNAPARAVREYEDWAVPAFDVQLWREDLAYGLDADAILDRDLDVLHVQYSNSFYNRRSLMRLLRHFPGVIALTYHDKDVPHATFPHRLADLLYTHREDVGVGPRRLLPQGVELHPPVVKTFGLGASRSDLIGEVCERNGWRFEMSPGGARWVEGEALYRWLRDCDAIVLWYDDRPDSGGSAAAPLALSTRRPVFVNDVSQFADLRDGLATLRKLRSLGELEAELRDLFAKEMSADHSWERVAARLVNDYREALANHGSRGRGARMRSHLFAAVDRKPMIAHKRRLVGPRPGVVDG